MSRRWLATSKKRHRVALLVTWEEDRGKDIVYESSKGALTRHQIALFLSLLGSKMGKKYFLCLQINLPKGSLLQPPQQTKSALWSSLLLLWTLGPRISDVCVCVCTGTGTWTCICIWSVDKNKSRHVASTNKGGWLGHIYYTFALLKSALGISTYWSFSQFLSIPIKRAKLLTQFSLQDGWTWWFPFLGVMSEVGKYGQHTQGSKVFLQQRKEHGTLVLAAAWESAQKWMWTQSCYQQRLTRQTGRACGCVLFPLWL